QECWRCKGNRNLFKELSHINEIPTSELCPICKGTGILNRPATEISFKIPFYEDENLIVNLCGTIDMIGKFSCGCYTIGDWKNTTYWMEDEYLNQYAISKQLRI